MKEKKLIILVLTAAVAVSGCCTPYKKYLKKTDNISLELRDLQRELSEISRESREIDDRIVTSQDMQGIVMGMQNVNDRIGTIQKRTNDMNKAMNAIKAPCHSILKPYHKDLKKLIATIYEKPFEFMYYSDEPMKIKVNDELKDITLEKLWEYDTFLPDMELITDYMETLDSYWRASRLKLSGRNFYAYKLEDYVYKDKKGKLIQTYLVDKREVLVDNVEAGYLNKLKDKMSEYELAIKNLITALIKTREKFNIFLAEKNAGKR